MQDTIDQVVHFVCAAAISLAVSLGLALGYVIGGPDMAFIGSVVGGLIAGLACGLIREFSEAGGSRSTRAEVEEHFRSGGAAVRKDLFFWSLGGAFGGVVIGVIALVWLFPR